MHQLSNKEELTCVACPRQEMLLSRPPSHTLKTRQEASTGPLIFFPSWQAGGSCPKDEWHSQPKASTSICTSTNASETSRLTVPGQY